jgi:single-stranded DNA-binding protein
MVSINQIQITGNITAVPELKAIGQGEEQLVVEGTVIHNWRLPEGAATAEKRAILPFKIYGAPARRFAESVSPKVNVLLTGHLETDEWKNGDQPRSRTFLLVRSFQYNSPKGEPVDAGETSLAKAKTKTK